jgi:hypothetical protein
MTTLGRPCSPVFSFQVADFPYPFSPYKIQHIIILLVIILLGVSFRTDLNVLLTKVIGNLGVGLCRLVDTYL